MFVIYRKQDSLEADRLANILSGKGIPFDQRIIGRDISSHDYVQAWPHVHETPFVVEDGKPVGGYNDLIERINDQFFGKSLLNEEF